MQQIKLFRYFCISILLVINGVNLNAQTTKIAIVSLEDTTLVHQHVGLTAFANFTDTLQFKLATSKYIEKQLKKYLSSKYSASIVQLPEYAVNGKKELFDFWGGMNKNIKNWLISSKDQYDLVIFINNIQIPREMNILVQKNTSGVYSRWNMIGFYTTITFSVYRTADLKNLEYYNLGGKVISPQKDFKLPGDKKTFTPEMIEVLKAGFKKHLDSRIEHFLTNTYLIAPDQLEMIKTETTGNLLP